VSLDHHLRKLDDFFFKLREKYELLCSDVHAP
jgi:hypothetical protein